jgi:hypothetical protein
VPSWRVAEESAKKREALAKVATLEADLQASQARIRLPCSNSVVLKTILSLRVTYSRQCQLALHATDEPGKRGERSLVLEPGNP